MYIFFISSLHQIFIKTIINKRLTNFQFNQYPIDAQYLYFTF